MRSTTIALSLTVIAVVLVPNALGGANPFPPGSLENPGTSCLSILEDGADPIDQLYFVTLGGVPTEVFCDMNRFDGGWTLIARAFGNSGDHRNIGVVGTLDDPNQGTVAKLSDDQINELRGPTLVDSVFMMETDDGFFDFFRDARVYDTLGCTESINRVYDTYADALSLTGGCNGQYNTCIHQGLIGWGCYNHFLYSDNPGFRQGSYKNGKVWVKAITP